MTKRYNNSLVSLVLSIASQSISPFILLEGVVGGAKNHHTVTPLIYKEFFVLFEVRGFRL
jgi:hypothetical protein